MRFFISPPKKDMEEKYIYDKKTNSSKPERQGGIGYV